MPEPEIIVRVEQKQLEDLIARNKEKTIALSELQTSINKLLANFLDEEGKPNTAKIMDLVALVNPLNFSSKKSKEKKLKSIINIDDILLANQKAVKALENERTN